MITVRFASGFSVRYNSATFAQNRSEFTDLLTKEGGLWVAQVPNSSIVEFTAPCRTYFAGKDETKAENRALQHKLDLARRQLAKLKKERKQQ